MYALYGSYAYFQLNSVFYCQDDGHHIKPKRPHGRAAEKAPGFVAGAFEFSGFGMKFQQAKWSTGCSPLLRAFEALGASMPCLRAYLHIFQVDGHAAGFHAWRVRLPEGRTSIHGFWVPCMCEKQPGCLSIRAVCVAAAPGIKELKLSMT